MDNGICNGAIGVIQDFVPHAGVPMPIVLFSNGIKMQIPFKYWQSEEFPTLAIAQIPLRLAWAMTIHKIQGATLPMAEIDIGLSIFECGQTYVALSRVQSLEGLYLCGFDPSRIKVHPKVRDFYNTIPLVEYEEEDTVDASSASVQPDPNIKTVNLSFQQYAYMPV
jgi:ATP-dependent DNA helicase PIF1